MANGGSSPEDAAGTTGTAAEIIEHRLALIVNGGVSLAVWMGGVACEIENARRASNGIPPRDDATEQEKALYAAWASVTRRAGVRLTVDVIAGTSAGGLNGVLQAAAIARGASLDHLKQLWLDSGQMSAGALFQPQQQGTLSLMSGSFFLDQITGALKTMTPTAHGQDISLIVTSTALGDSSRRVEDSKQQHFFEADHRRRFHFVKHGPRPRYDQVGDGYELRPGEEVDHLAGDDPLARAARASASFPVAFAPVEETRELRDRRVWPNWPTGDSYDWLADGGILDNSPFEPVLDAIQARSVTGQWRRTLCFVVPSGDQGTLGQDITPPAAPAAGQASQKPSAPPPWTSVAAAAFSFPREADFRDDIEQLHRTIRNGRSSFDVSRFLLLTKHIPPAPPEADGQPATTPATAAAPAAPPPNATLSEARTICTAAIPLYQQSAAAAAIYQVWDIIARSSPDGYIEPSREVPDLLLNPAELKPVEHPWLPDAFPAAGEGLPGRWDWSADAADRVVRTLLRATSDLAGRDPLRQRLSACLHEIAAINRAVNQHLASAGGGNASLPVEAAIELLDDTYATLQAGPALAGIVRTATESYAGLHLANRAAAPDVLAAALAVEVSNGAGSMPSERPRPLFDFVRIGLDQPPPLLKTAYDAAMSPLSDGATPPSRDNILYGARLDHFAAFGDRKWRAWDWLWGRMNALAHLGSILGLTDAEVDELAQAVLAAEGTDLASVQASIGTVVRQTPAELIGYLRSTGNVAPAALDALFALIRSQATTDPALQPGITEAGQIASDLLARRAGAGQVSHPILRIAAWIPRRLLWKRVNPG
jgi:predicted acylesterase/phospholipase RssA